MCLRTFRSVRHRCHRLAAAIGTCLVAGLLAPSTGWTDSPDAGTGADAGPPPMPEAAVRHTSFQAAPRTRVDKESREALERRIDSVLAQRVSESARVGMYVVDVETGQTLYARRKDELFNPASNTKLFTSATALDVLGPEHTFETRLLVDAPDDGERSIPEDGTLEQPLYLEGEGEPFLLFEDVVHWAAMLKLKGVERLAGGIVVDDRAFDGRYLPPVFGAKDEDDSYRASIGAVSVDFNAVTVVIEPTDALGMAPEVRLVPPNEHVQVTNRARTVEGRSRRCRIASDPDGEGGTEIVVRGTIGREAEPARRRMRVDNPPRYAASVFRRSLEMVGIEVEGPIRTGRAPDERHVLFRHESQPLSYVVKAMNKWSNNFMAEQLLRSLGHVGGVASTWDRSRRVLDDFLTRAGLDAGEMQFKNGSGLYDANRVSPAHVVGLLRAMLEHPTGPEFVSSLAIAGRDGTLEDRMTDGPAAGRLRAKTGTLNRVSALSGYVRTVSGRQLAFSMLFNETPRRGWLYRPVQDELAHVLAAFDG